MSSNNSNTVKSDVMSTSNTNTAKQQQQYHCIGFGSNYFHAFTDEAISIQDIFNSCNTVSSNANVEDVQVSNDQGGIEVTSSSSSQLDNNNNSSSGHDSHTSTTEQTDQEDTNMIKSLPSHAFVVPLSPTLHQQSLPKQEKKSFFQKVFRRKKKPKELFVNTTNATEQTKDTNADTEISNKSTLAIELPYGTTTPPASQIDIGLTHISYLQNEIYTTGTLHGNTYSIPQLLQPRIPLKCTKIACGRRHTLGLFEGKVVMSWGSGYFGQLGHGMDTIYTKDPLTVERLLPRFVGGEIVDVAAGGMQSAVIVSGDVSYQEWNSIKLNPKAGFETRVFRFGSNKFGQCAVEGGRCNVVAHPTPMVDVYHPETGRRITFVQVALGKLHSVGLTNAGEVYSWGSLATGRCGHGDGSLATTKSLMKSRNGVALPKRIETLKNVKIASISAGMAHTLALSGSGRVFSWGNNASGQLGLGHTMHLIAPRLVSDLEFANIARTAKGDVSEAAEVSSNSAGNNTSATDSSDHSNTAQESDEVMAKARSIHGALAPIHYPSSPQKKATQKATSSGAIAPKITSIHAAGSYSAAISSNGDIYTWGCGDANQLGHPPPPNDIEAAETVSAQRHLTKGIRTRDIKSFDSRLNVLLPRRVECLNTLGLKTESIATGDNYLIAVCSKTNESEDDDETYAMGKTLYEIELEKKEKGLDRIRVVRSSG
ncbi:hypothetical protein CTEN210_09127 [Chaetoceros tenuissimus]|uniref:RCC1-like domain-containing protein n=1 Tax=Chaetoceros tenuissimus TaxID=426638 RepID=A0AAD3H727_9STRA|nr:hypothetical protein CTEN210_09127 [Chaetoceros tenuissimus]